MPISSIHKRRLKAIRKYIKFNYDLRKPLSNYAKRKIKQYYDEYLALTARPYYVYRSRSKEHLRIAQEFSGHGSLTQFKVAFIPTADMHPRIEFKKGKLVLHEQHITTQYLPFDPEELYDDTAQYIEELIEEVEAEVFSIRVGGDSSGLDGRYEIQGTADRDSIAEEVEYLIERYSSYDDSGNPTSQHPIHWLAGLASHNFKNQADLNSYQKAKSEAKRALKIQRRKSRIK